MASISFEELKQLLVENCMLKSDPSEITPDTLFFGPGSLGLDSIDALQMTLAIEKKYGIPIKDPETARQVLRNLHTLREWLIRQSTC